MNWISVKERLPKDNIQVLMYDVVNDEVYIGRYLYSQPSFPVFGSFGRGRTFDITHWMPLPEPPKQ
jgi:hypothetical protein